MKYHQLALVIAGSAALLLSGCATKKSSDSDAPTGPPAATVTYKGGQAAYWASAQGGKGTLYFNGNSYGFTSVGAGAGGTGAQEITATGEVYNLTKLSDFPGTYTGPRSGLTLFKGKMHAKLTNDKGVIIYMSGTTAGLASGTGGSSIIVTLN